MRYLKVGSVGSYIRVLDECARLRWAVDHLPVPEVVDCGTEGEADWILMTPMPGRDATAEELRADPARLVPILARGLREFHCAPVDRCPFDYRLKVALARVRARVAKGMVDPAQDFHPEHRHLTLEGALAELEQAAPATEDLVVCHGDYCLPNVLVAGDAVAGYVDIGELGVADRWWDIAVGSWSVTWNLGPGWEDLFFDSYGVEPDPARIAYYRLLYDLAS